MNGEVQPSVPIVSLAGLSNLTNLLSELPLPTPKEPHGKKRSLLFNPRVADEARRVLATADPNIVSQMAHILQQTNVDHIQVKEPYNSTTVSTDVPELVRVLLAQYPNALTGIPRQNYVAQNYSSNQSFSHPEPISHSNAFQENTAPSSVHQSSHTANYSQGSAPTSGVYLSASNSAIDSYSPFYNQPTPAHHPQQVSSFQQQQPQSQQQLPPQQQQPSAFQSQYTNSDISQLNSKSVDLSAHHHRSIGVSSKTSEKSGHLQENTTLSVHKLNSPNPDVVQSTKDAKKEFSKHMEPQTATNIPSKSTDAEILKAVQPQIRLKKLDVSSGQYQVAGASSGLKIKLTKTTDGGSSRLQDKRPLSSEEEDMENPKKKKKKHKSKEHKSLRKTISESTDVDADYNSAQLSALVDTILDGCSTDDLPSTTPVFGENFTLSAISDALINRSVLSELVNEAAKLKGTSATKEISKEKLSKLMFVLQWNVRDGAELVPLAEQNDNDDDILRDIVMDRVIRSVDSALASLYIMTSLDMPKVVYVEDLIELIADTVKHQLTNTIYPEYDPVYDTKTEKDYSSDKKKRSKASGTKHKVVMLMYNKLCDIVQNLTDLVSVEPLTDTIILKISALAVQPFFVENISELQLSAITLVTEIFSRYEKHRQLILDDMFLSLARLPTSKRNLRTYRLNHEENIQMVTALVLQLIQCIIKLPKKVSADCDDGDDNKETQDDVMNCVLLTTSYEQAMKTAHQFLSVFLKKCGQKGEEDFRPLFDNFINDLLVTANKPEWPSSELMLSLLGRILVQQFSNKQVDMTLRVASLDYLGTVAARLRRDAVSTQQTAIDQILDSMTADESTDDERDSAENTDVPHRLQMALLDYLLVNGQKDPSLLNARGFYIAQWYRDIVLQCEKIHTKQSQVDVNEVERIDQANQSLADAEKKKKKLLEQARIVTKTYRNDCCLGYCSASDVTKFLTSQRPFAQSFEIYLAQILKVLSETAVAVRTKAIKCLTQVIESDAGVLARTDMQHAVHARLLDQSTSVREACVELIGKFILNRPDLVSQYYNMLSDRILDTGISVRKRVIKIFRDICVEMPNFEKIPDMCVKMIRRVNDEDGIKKLVSEVFQTMWFTPTKDKDLEKLMRKVLNITAVISAIQDTNYDFIEHLMKHLFHREEDASSKPMEVSCKQIIDCLVMNVLKLEQKAVELSSGKVSTSRDLLASLSTLHLFSKVRPDLVSSHAETLQPYLEIKCSNTADSLVLHHTARILELVIPLLENPRESFLAQVEEDLMTLILSQGMTVLQSAVSCLGAVVNKLTKNFALVRDCFKKFQNIVFNCHKEHQTNPNNPALKQRKAALRRSLFTIGVICKHFDFDSQEMGMLSQSGNSIEDFVFEQLMYFLWHEDCEIRLSALTGLGFFCIRYHDKMMNSRVKELYHRLLIGKDVSTDMRVQVLNNIGKYLQEEEDRQVKAEEQWKKLGATENLKEMGDVQAGMASTVVQVYLKQVMESYFCSQMQVRIAVVNVLHLILKQGLIHPVPCVPYLIAMSTDCDNVITIKADQHLIEIDKKYSGFIHMKAMAGIKMSYRLHRLIQQDLFQPLRGIRNNENPQAFNHHLYSIIRTNRAHRRALLMSMLNMFDDTSKTLLGELVYLADNLAFFPYQAADEPLFIVHNIDIIVSVAGSNILQAFREGLLTKDGEPYEASKEPVEPSAAEHITADSKTSKTKFNYDDDEDEDVESLLKRLPSVCKTLQELMITAQGCALLLQVKQHLKEMYAINEGKLSKYSPNEAQKVWEKPINRKVNHQFNPSQALELLRLGSPQIDCIDHEGRIKLVENYLQFKSVMMSVDPNDDEEVKKQSALSPTANADEGTDPDVSGLADTQNEITSYNLEEADAIAASMQPTISLMPLDDLSTAYLSRTTGPSTSR